MYLLGYDLGSSSIKASLVEATTGVVLATANYPDSEMDIISKQADWAEQRPEDWWENARLVTNKLLRQFPVDPVQIQSIGISYQMHGLVLVDKNKEVIRPAIIWCDSRAVKIGEEAFDQLGNQLCLKHVLNSPGNFTASKLKWVKENEPENYSRIYKIMLPGDFLAMKMTDEICTTVSGLSEGIMWDFQTESIATFLLQHFGIEQELIPNIKPSISIQGYLTVEAADFLGLAKGTTIGYRAGDQPNNAISLNVLHPGEFAATGGTSGVVYGVVEKPLTDPLTRINSFAHVNHTANNPRIGVLLCINGAGIQYSWMRKMLDTEQLTYFEIEEIISNISPGANGIKVFPFGNGTERMLKNKDLKSSVSGLNFNIHSKAHLYRAALEGIAFSFVYGIEIMKELGMEINVLKVGNDNLFQSEIFSTTIATLLNCEIEMMDTTGAVGAAKASGVAVGIYPNIETAMKNIKLERTYLPNSEGESIRQAYSQWKIELEKLLK